MPQKLKFFGAFLLLVFLQMSNEAQAFSRMFAFGDSLSDAGDSASSELSLYKSIGGRCDPLHPCPTYYQGRLSNGPVAVEQLAQAILPGGTAGSFFDFAVAGSTSGVGNFGDGGSQSGPGVFGLPGMAQQLVYFFTNFDNSVNNDALYVVWGGANDFLTSDLPFDAAHNIVGYVSALATFGAETILVPNIPNLGATPFVQALGFDAVAAAEGFTQDFNDALAIQLNNLAPLFPNTHIQQFDTFGFFNSIVQDPAAYGFTNITDACVNLPAVCANADEYLFWDDFHPTARMHALLANELLSQVPLPGALVFFLSGLIFVITKPLRFKD